MADKNVEMLRNAVARNSGAVLSLPSAGMLRNYKSRFYAELEGGILLELPGCEEALIKELVIKQIPCGISFRGGVHNVVFAATIRRAEIGWRLNDSSTVDALLINFPTTIKATQRRNNYRVEIPPDTDIFVRVWRMSHLEDIKEQPSATKEVCAEIRDLSTGGVGVKLMGVDGAPPKVCEEDRLRVELKYQGKSLIIEGRMRKSSAASKGDSISTGIQFKNLQDTLESRQILARITRIIGELHRWELRRIQLGLMKAS